ncbi:hypothetical protein D9615_010253 [Tricholomella constricta]|uniref:FAD-binding domain-containing protein n=1 Tax=Tricholomella constricta TaxID=117010 RepID=A0A8H5LTP9_9AGAR|nr:hypothetical protein D9615_010253 [Tricholomella constricta]
MGASRSSAHVLGFGLSADTPPLSEQHLHNHRGDLLNVQPLPELEFGARAYNGHRGQMHAVLLEYARSLGLDIRLGMHVSEYWEDPARGVAGVVVRGQRLEGNLVVGADGVKSKARTHVLGYKDAPKASGYAIYRAWFNAQRQGIDRDPLTDFMCKGEDVVYAWIGQDVHFITSCSQNGTAVSCVLTHRDNSDIEESWSLAAKIEDVLDVVRDWDPRCSAILSKAPSFVDWKLVHRDPLPSWISMAGHLVLIGDAAHPFLPTSIQGASQAMEDGVTLAVTLQLSGKTKVPHAVRIWEHMRYQRVRLAQLMGESTRDNWHRTNSNDSCDRVLDLPRPEWLFAFDAERHAYDVYEKVSRDIQERGYEQPTLP